MNAVDEERALSAAIAQLYDIGNRLLDELAVHEPAPGKRFPDDVRATANLMLARRTAEFVHSAVDDFHFNRPAAGAATGRSILETAATLRWVLQSDSNAQRWWKAGDAQIQTVLRALGLSSDPNVVALRDGATIPVGLPGFNKMARDGGIELPYKRWYAVLSGYAHPTRMASTHSHGVVGHLPPAPPVIPCIYFATDVGLVFSTWATRGEVPAPHPHP